MRLFLISILLGVLTACSPGQFASWQTEEFAKTPITGMETKVLSFRNETDSSQKILGVGFDGSGDGRQHFQLSQVSIGTKQVSPKDIILPPGSSLNVELTYQPRNLETTKADFGGWVTGAEERFEPYNPAEQPKASKEESAIHRIMLLIVYQEPQTGIAQVQLVGHAVPGPNGEVVLPETGSKDCTAAAGTACFTGRYSMDIPELFSTGPIEADLPGPIRFNVEGGSAGLAMENMPPILLPLQGNGPGEPLEGQPVSAVTIAIRGASGITATGSFDGSRLELTGLAFRIQVIVGTITAEQLAQAAPLVDFTIENLTLTTEQPLTDGNVAVKIDTKLSKTPSGNPLFDNFLGGAQVIVRFSGELALP